MAEEEKEAKSGGKGILIVLIALIVILLLAVVGGGYFLYTEMNKAANPGGAMQEKTVMKADASGEKANFQAAINDLVLNITNAKGREKLMKLSFTLKSSEETIEGLIEENKAEIVVVIAQISARSSEELLTVGGKALLKEELLEEINSVINEATSDNSDIKRNSVKKLFFTSFVIK